MVQIQIIHKIKAIKMGNESNQHYSFNRHDWELIEKNVNYSLWRNRQEKSIQIEQYNVFSRGQEQFKQQKQVFHFRYRHKEVVSGLYFDQKQEQEFCSMSHRYSLFIERIPIRLTDIEHIPFPDYLHLYQQALIGFRDISKRYGCFQVQEEYFGVNERGIVKVWMNRDFSKNLIVGGKITQQQMVKGIIDIIDANCDQYRVDGIPSVRNYLYRNSDLLKFQEAFREFQTYLLTYNQGRVPSKLECIERVGGIQVIVNRQDVEEQSDYPSKTLIVQHQPELERPKLVTETLINPAPRPLPPPQEQPIQSRPPVQYGLKGSEMFPNSKREQFIIKPQAIRQNMEVVRRRKSQYENPPVKAEALRPMKYSQTIGQANKNSWVTSPVKAQPGKISFIVSPQKGQSQIINQKAPSQLIHQKAPVFVKNQAPPNIHNNQRVVSQQSNQEITFQRLTNTSNQPPVIHNTSITNVSINTSGSNTQRIVMKASNGPQPERPLPVQEQRPQQIIKEERARQIIKGERPPSIVQEERPRQIIKVDHPVETVLIQNEQKFKIEENIVPNQTIPEVIVERKEEKSFEDFSPVPEKKQEISYSSKVEERRPQSKEITLEKYEESPQKQTPFNNIKQVEASFQESESPSKLNQSYENINADDGKSSEQFMRKLKQITSGIATNHFQQQSTDIAPTSTYEQKRNTSNYEPSYQTQPIPEPYSNLHVDDQDFGRPAESNIIYTHQQSSPSKYQFGKQREPLKFEKDLEMKYSMLQSEDSEPKNNQHQYKGYSSNIDPALLADMNALKS